MTLENNMEDIIYFRKVNYYETDQMQCVHHSNYIRYFEESRTYFLEEIGYPYHIIEECKIFSPVISMHAEYKKPLTFGDEFYIIPRITKFTGVRMTISYEVFKADNNDLVCTGYSEHCFQDDTGKILSIKRADPEMYEAFLSYVKEV